MLQELITMGSLPLLVVALLAAGMGVPIPEDPAILAAGVVAHRTPVPWWLALPTVYLAALVADCLLYFWARRFGEGLLSRRPFRFLITPKRRAQVSRLFERFDQKQSPRSPETDA